MSEEEHKLKQQLEEEAKASQMIEDYLKNHYEELAGQVRHFLRGGGGQFPPPPPENCLVKF